MKRTAFVSLITLCMIAGIVWLQVFLSKKQSRWPGLLLPAICFCYSLLMVFGLAAFNGMTGGEVFLLVASTLLAANIPTLVLLAIYFACREKPRRKKELDRMNVQDLD